MIKCEVAATEFFCCVVQVWLSTSFLFYTLMNGIQFQVCCPLHKASFYKSLREVINLQDTQKKLLSQLRLITEYTTKKTNPLVIFSVEISSANLNLLSLNLIGCENVSFSNHIFKKYYYNI